MSDLQSRKNYLINNSIIDQADIWTIYVYLVHT